MPDSKNIPEITQEEASECWNIVRSPKYESIFDPNKIGTMKNRKPIILHGNEEKRIISQPYRPIPPQLEEELSDHLRFLRDNGKIVDVNPNVETRRSPEKLLSFTDKYHVLLKGILFTTYEKKNGQLWSTICWINHNRF